MKYTEAAFKALEEKAIKFAMEAHGGQLYGNDKPYTWHLRQVVENVKRWAPYLPHNTVVEHLVIAAWLHDIVEDTHITLEEVRTEFGEEVATFVDCVTNEPGSNRKERAQATYKKIRSCPQGVFLKLMDRLSNVEAGGKTEMYKKEFADFKFALFKEHEFEPIWNYLQHLLV